MKILHVIGTLDATTGGPPVVAACLAAAQQRLGNRAEIACCPPPNGPEAEASLISRIPGADQLSIHHVPDSSGLDRFMGRAAEAALTPLIEASDIVHLHGMWEAVLAAAVRIARRLGKPYVIAPHGMLDPWSLGQGRLKKKLAIKLWYARLWRGASFFHLLNADEARLIQPLKLARRTEIIPNGVFLEEIEPLPEPCGFRADHRELGNDPYILFLSRLHFKKGLDYLAGAFAKVAAKHDRVRLVVAGPDDGALEGFENQVRDAGLSGRVHVVGPIYGRQKYEALVDAACFCLPSRQEGFSIAITEALACGTPVVISTACHFPEVAQAKAGHVVPLEIDRIAQSLLDLLGDESKRRQMSQNATELIHRRYTWPKIAEQTLEAYRTVVDTDATGPAV